MTADQLFHRGQQVRVFLVERLGGVCCTQEDKGSS